MKQAFPAVALLALLVGLFVEQSLWGETMKQTPDEISVMAFEIEEEGLSVILTDAIKAQREIVEFLTDQADGHRADWFGWNSEGYRAMAEGKLPALARAESMQFDAMRVLGLLEAAREREAGQVT